MDRTWTLREVTPADAADVARAQIDARCAAYSGILPTDYLVRLDHGHVTTVWEQRPAARRAPSIS